MKNCLLLMILLALPVSIYGSDDCDDDGFLTNCEVTDTDEDLTSQKKSTVPVYTELTDGKVYLYYFYTYDCTHCAGMKKLLHELKQEYPRLAVKSFEVKKDADNLALFQKTARAYDTVVSGVPAVFVGDTVVTGFDETISRRRLRAAIEGVYAGSTTAQDPAVALPFLNADTISRIPLFPLSFYIGLLDGFNPCAMWVLTFLLGLLLRTKERGRMLMIGSVYLVASGIVYFAFMAAWLNIFLFLGLSRIITVGLGVVAIIIALINIKDFFFFKRGVSLSISGKQKPALYHRAGAIVKQKNILTAVAGTILFAFFVNLIELGCTAGLPAVYTRILSVRGIDSCARYFYMTVYVCAYVIPLLVIVLLFVFTMKRFHMTEKHGRILKGLSGVLMFCLGIMLIAFNGTL